MAIVMHRMMRMVVMPIAMRAGFASGDAGQNNSGKAERGQRRTNFH